MKVPSLSESTIGLSASQVSFLALLMGGLLGFAGLLSLALMVWFSHQNFGVDQGAKHGISVKDTSRMGGVAIALFLVTVWLSTILFPRLVDGVNADAGWGGPSFLLLAGLLACIGFLDDLGTRLTPVVRLVTSTFILAVGFVFVPDWMPNQLGALVGGALPGYDIGLVAVSVFVCVGFINAGNMSDGANGLFSGICLAFFLCAWKLSGEYFYFSISIGLLSFFLINVLTGRIIMGDFGAYGLSALIALVGFDHFDQGLVGLGFLATLLSYPCLEIVRIFGVRIANGQSPFRADNQHSHNMLNGFFSRLIKSKTVANSVTGVTIALLSVTPGALILLQESQRNDLLCFAVFGAQSCLFGLGHVAAIAFKQRPQTAVVG